VGFDGGGEDGDVESGEEGRVERGEGWVLGVEIHVLTLWHCGNSIHISTELNKSRNSAARTLEKTERK
jgi:hypothetical protein